MCSYGVGAILGVQKGRGNVMEAEDMAVVLGRWAGDEDLTDAAVAKASASLVGKVGGKATASILAKTMVEKAGLLVGKKIGGKLEGAKARRQVRVEAGGQGDRKLDPVRRAHSSAAASTPTSCTEIPAPPLKIGTGSSFRPEMRES